MQSIQDNVEPLYVDEKMAARIVAMSVSKLQKLRVVGDGPVFSKIGRLVRYSREDLHAFIACQAGHQEGRGCITLPYFHFSLLGKQQTTSSCPNLRCENYA